jgi:hypothetical protein
VNGLLIAAALAVSVPAPAPVQSEQCAKLERKMSKPGYWATFGAALAASVAAQETSFYSARVGGTTYSGSVRYTNYAKQDDYFEANNEILQNRRMAKLKKKYEAAGCVAPALVAVP